MNNERIKELLKLIQKEPHGLDKEMVLKHCTQAEFYELADKKYISSNPFSSPDFMTYSKVKITPLGNYFIKNN